ncbi:hypothetical protein AN639_04260 [Candidatus Epulonipiscium fishelsonii]|uniref:Uncharacterized protein n=1 Tax=Candidatus Epulonipiscium fishelsonii TaxID=77094 RepID=A0ACC8XFQ7_9FIRM|nr:hypothetical protein AN639_04260 [Epulopiscium sp. SCG-B05WGA-EpuloA1]ONI42109.1 hypothetical protein AN396_02460 [Epulopiscium sp. SCG-B11WGA-EpuloA1]
MKQVQNKYPNLVNKSRKIYTYEDTDKDNSYETYLRGELCTYSYKTLVIYLNFLKDSINSNINVVQQNLENMVHLYGYKDLASAEIVN